MTTTATRNKTLLTSPLAERLYADAAHKLPVIDYHNHLDPAHLAVNKKFDNIAEAWVMGDPYKHRAMRICGVPEYSITGGASPKEKFMHWAATLPKTIGNSLHHWSAMELHAVFGIEQTLNSKTAEMVWEQCNHQLALHGAGAVDILKGFHAEILCTSDDLLDDLAAHKEATANHDIQVLPSLRGDSILAFDKPEFKTWFGKLESTVSAKIKTLDDYKSAIVQRLAYFAEAGCRLADHSLDGGFHWRHADEKIASDAFHLYVQKGTINAEQLVHLQNHLLLYLGTAYAGRGWALQLHMGAQRYTSTRLRNLAGAAGGYAAIGSGCDMAGLASLLDAMEKEGALPKLILYPLNPMDYTPLASITGSYAEDGIPGKIQLGPAWWYNDHFAGIRNQLTALVSYGLLSPFIGMTTDSRSVFSFSRHRYFREILCGQISEWVDAGLMPNDEQLLTGLVSDISYHNIKKWIFND
jgi:glucuronate isomerase